MFELEDSDRRIAFLEDGEGRIRWFMNGTRSWVRLNEALFADVDGVEHERRLPNVVAPAGVEHEDRCAQWCG